MDESRNYYRVLHLQPDAPIELVRVNYRTLIQKLRIHPDLGGENWHAADLNVAYRTLSDPERRAAYDRDLLSRYGIDFAVDGPQKRRGTPPRSSHGDGINRRNYYRVLQTQNDAPLAVLEASHQALRDATPEHAALLDEALAFLRNTELRAAYDRLLEVYDHQDALAHVHLEFGGKRGYAPIIRSYCRFCKHPHAKVDDGNPETRCDECKSPLFPPPRQLLGRARRAVERAIRSQRVWLHFDWPSEGVPGELVDLSPLGMRCETEAPLDRDDIVKVTSEEFDAVGSVAHFSRIGAITNAGLRFLAVRFPQLRGNFRSLKA